MTTAHADINEYFATASSVSKKLVHDCEIIRKSYGDDWDAFSEEERDAELWNNLVHPDITEKYSSYPQPHTQDSADVFPKLKIQSGEKIVVDFENDDGWTWRDEHSGPFSWRSRSQQDLRLFEVDAPVEADTARKPSRPSQVSANTPKSSIWQSPFLRGQNSSNIHPDTAEVFSKFGISFGDSWNTAVSEPEGSVGSESVTETTSAEVQSSCDVQSTRLEDGGGYENHSLHPGFHDSPEPSAVHTMTVDVTNNDYEIGQVSPAFESDPDDVQSVDCEQQASSESAEYDREMESLHSYFSDAYSELSANSAMSPVTQQPRATTLTTNETTNEGPEITDMADNATSDNVSESNASVMSGYDFLDNW